MRTLTMALVGAVVLCTRVAAAAEVVAQFAFPQVRCRVASCKAVGTVALEGAAGTLVPAGTTLVRWDGATFTIDAAATLPALVAVTSPDALYEVPEGEVLGVEGYSNVTATAVDIIGRYTTAAGAGSIVSPAAAVTYYDDATRTPYNFSLAYHDGYPREFVRVARQYQLTHSFFVAAFIRGDLSLEAARDVIALTLTPPRPALATGTKTALAEYSLQGGFTTFAAPLYTEPRLAGRKDIAQGIAECGLRPNTGTCWNVVAYVRPERLPALRAACALPSGYLDGNCPALRAHDWVRWAGVQLGGAHRCLVGEGPRAFAGYQDDPFACQYTYGGDTLPPEAEEAIYQRVRQDFEAQ